MFVNSNGKWVNDTRSSGQGSTISEITGFNSTLGGREDDDSGSGDGWSSAASLRSMNS